MTFNENYSGNTHMHDAFAFGFWTKENWCDENVRFLLYNFNKVGLDRCETPKLLLTNKMWKLQFARRKQKWKDTRGKKQKKCWFLLRHKNWDGWEYERAKNIQWLYIKNKNDKMHLIGVVTSGIFSL